MAGAGKAVRRRGAPQTGLAESAFLPPPTLTKLVDQFVDQNLVHRRADPYDRRRVLARLTPRGQEYWRRVDGAVRAGRPPFGDDDLLRSLLERPAATLEDAAHM
ncbi:MarR family transcriptional regulator [Streptomyces sp. NPDC047880]|uniref:MarR family transcriptional regulator n=1 Tax=Streptomyces sp. NPDC047880 TaxID=3155626 RepID=UPI00345423F9